MQVKIIATTKRNEQNNTHRSEMTKSDRKSDKRGENKNLPRKATTTPLKVPCS